MTHSLLSRLHSARLAEDQLSHGGDPIFEPVQRKWHNVGIAAAVAITERWLQEERIRAGLRELAAAPALDLRVKQALTGSVP